MRAAARRFWILLWGWWLAVTQVVTGVALCIMVMGMGLGLASFRLSPVSVVRFGAEISDA